MIYSNKNTTLIPEIFSSINSIFSICLSNEALEPFSAGSNCNFKECIEQEAIINCSIGSWSSMLCIIGSSNALQRTIRSHYPNTGDRRISTVLNSTYHLLSIYYGHVVIDLMMSLHPTILFHHLLSLVTIILHKHNRREPSNYTYRLSSKTLWELQILARKGELALISTWRQREFDIGFPN